MNARSGALSLRFLFNNLGRQVRKGEKALELCQPVTCKRQPTDAAPDTPKQGGQTFTRFIYRRNWFTLCQTDGEPYTPEAPTDWDRRPRDRRARRHRDTFQAHRW